MAHRSPLLAIIILTHESESPEVPMAAIYDLDSDPQMRDSVYDGTLDKCAAFVLGASYQAWESGA